jgi:ribosomal protein S18 acetylase RimI-like enzyme
MRRDLAVPIAPAPLPQGVRIVPFDETNARATRELMNRVYAQGFGDQRSYEDWWPWLSGDSEYDRSLVFVAVADSGVVGVCQCWTGAFIKDVVVDPAMQGQGIGAALVTLALQAFAARNAPHVDLKTDVANAKAQSLYRRLRFEVVEGTD